MRDFLKGAHSRRHGGDASDEQRLQEPHLTWDKPGPPSTPPVIATSATAPTATRAITPRALRRSIVACSITRVSPDEEILDVTVFARSVFFLRARQLQFTTNKAEVFPDSCRKD